MAMPNPTANATHIMICNGLVLLTSVFAAFKRSAALAAALAAALEAALDAELDAELEESAF